LVVEREKGGERGHGERSPGDFGGAGVHERTAAFSRCRSQGPVLDIAPKKSGRPRETLADRAYSTAVVSQRST
jgi:hypothetical protein